MSIWTLDALKEYVDAEIKAIRATVTAAFDAAETAADKYQDAARETLQAHNDLIRQSRDRDATYATKDDVEHTTDLLTATITANRHAFDTAIDGLRENVRDRRGEIDKRFDDPDQGIYARLNKAQSSLRNWAIAVLTTALIAIILAAVNLATHH